MEPLGAHDPDDVGPYRLRARLGAGGMGRVYLGAAPDGALVAIKVVHPGLAHDERFRARFRREVEISRRVTGPWVAAVVDADPDAEQPWLATQYVRGPSLGAAVEALGPLPAGTVQVLAHGLAAALGAIHGAGLVHRDLKPSNVLLDADHPRLIDFGISRAADGTQMTSTGMVVGTPAFMSPEQITGAEVGPASDVFSLGSVLCYAATGRSPFGDALPVVLMLRISREEPDLDEVPAVLRGSIAACLAKRPEDRPVATELAGLLGAADANEPGWLPAEIAALGPDPGTPAGRDQRTRIDSDVQPAQGGNRLLGRRTMLIGIGILGIAGTAGLAVALNRAAPQTRWTLPFTAEDAVWAADNTALYVHSADNVVQALDRPSGEVMWSVPGGQPTVSPSPFRNLAAPGTVLVVGSASGVAGFDAATGRRLWEMARSDNFTEQIVVAEGIVLAVAEDSVVALDVATGNRLWTAAAPGAHLGGSGLAAGEGKGFLVMSSGRLVAWHLRTGQTAWTADTGMNMVARIVVERGVVCIGYDYAVLAVEAGTGRLLWETGGMGLVSVATREHFRAADGVLVAVTRAGGAEWVVDGLEVASGKVRWSVPGVSTSYRVITTGSTLYATAKGGPLSAYDVATGEQRWTYGNWRYEPVAAKGRDVYLVGEGEIHAITAE